MARHSKYLAHGDFLIYLALADVVASKARGHGFDSAILMFFEWSFCSDVFKQKYIKEALLSAVQRKLYHFTPIPHSAQNIPHASTYTTVIHWFQITGPAAPQLGVQLQLRKFI